MYRELLIDKITVHETGTDLVAARFMIKGANIISDEDKERKDHYEILKGTNISEKRYIFSPGPCEHSKYY